MVLYIYIDITKVELWQGLFFSVSEILRQVLYTDLKWPELVVCSHIFVCPLLICDLNICWLEHKACAAALWSVQGVNANLMTENYKKKQN